MQLIRPRILIGDDHGIIRRGISLLIQMEIGEYSITEAGTCSRVMAELNKTILHTSSSISYFQTAVHWKYSPTSKAFIPNCASCFFPCSRPRSMARQ